MKYFVNSVVLVHYFVSAQNWSLCFGLVLAGFPSCIVRRLDRILRSEDKLAGHTPKYVPVSACCMHWWCLALASCLAAHHLSDWSTCLAVPHWSYSVQLYKLCRRLSDLDSRRALRAVGELLVGRTCSTRKQRRAFSLVSAYIWTWFPLTYTTAASE